MTVYECLFTLLEGVDLAASVTNFDLIVCLNRSLNTDLIILTPRMIISVEFFVKIWFMSAEISPFKYLADGSQNAANGRRVSPIYILLSQRNRVLLS